MVHLKRAETIVEGQTNLANVDAKDNSSPKYLTLFANKRIEIQATHKIRQLLDTYN